MSGPTHLLRIYFTQYVCVCLSVCSNMSMPFLREFYNLVLEYMLVSDTPFLLLLFLVPLFDSTNMFSRSRYTFSLSISSCQTSLSATFLFFLCPFFPVGLFLSLSFSVSYVYIFSQTYLRFLMNTHALLSRPLRLLPFSIFECSVIIIILTCV